MIDLDRYFRRLGLPRDLPGDELLPRLQRAHQCSIPFENLDVLAGRPIKLDLDSLQRKLLEGGRGGYCFEHNRLLCQVLGQLGFAKVRTLAARVRRGCLDLRPHTHMLLEVEYRGAPHLVDAGFGGEGPATPLPFDGEAREGRPGIEHRLLQEDSVWVLQTRHDRAAWLDLYAFERHAHHAVDYEMYNYFTSTHPASLFTHSMLVGLHHPGGYRILFNRLLRVREEKTVSETTLTSDEQVLTTLQESFGLKAPEGCRLPSEYLVL